MVYTEKVLIPEFFGKFKNIFLLSIFTIVPVYALAVRNEIDIRIHCKHPLMQVTRKFYRRVLSSQIVRCKKASN